MKKHQSLTSARPTKLIAAFAAAISLIASPVMAVQVNWTDWITGNPGAAAQGTITTPTSTVIVSYSNPQTYYFIQTGGPDTDYWQNNLGPAGSPYTSSIVDNIPTASEMISLNQAGSQTLNFSETIANPFFSYVSLNGNGYAFDQDFDILSFGDASDPEGPNYSGFWGNGTSSKNVVDLGGGTFEYQLVGTGEPHGTIRFSGSFDTVSWRSLSSEDWNGFTVGIEGTSEEVFGVPDAGSTLSLLGGAFGVLAMARRRVRH